jgi:hypothetical protein
MAAFNSPKLSLPLKPRASRPYIPPPTDRISHHHSQFTGCARHYFPHLPSNAQGRIRRPPHHSRIKTPCKQTAHRHNYGKQTKKPKQWNAEARQRRQAN